jgi:hypothetical protein
MRTNLKRIAISTITAIAAIAGSATISQSQLFPSKESCQAYCQSRKCTCYPVPNRDAVIKQTLNGKGNITSPTSLTVNEALDAAVNFLGPGYTELGRRGSGVFRSADGTRQFRIDKNSVLGNHAPNVPHVHFEMYAPGARSPFVNNHVPIVE